MKKTIKMMALALAATFVFAACGKDDDTSGKQVEWLEGYYYSSYSSSTNGSFSRTKLSWEGGVLKRVENFDDNQRDGYIDIAYEEGKAKEVRRYNESGEMEASATIYYTDDKITRIHSTSNYDGETRESEGTFEYNSAGELVKATWSNVSYVSTTTFTWENGNIVEERDEDGDITTYAYDNKTNPLQTASIIAYIGDPDARTLSRNNIISKTSTYNGGSSTYKRECSYTYDGDYPSTATYNYSDGVKEVTYFRYTDGSGQSAPEMCRIKIEDGYDYESRPYYVYGAGTYAKGDKVIIRTNQDYYHEGTYYTFSHWGDGNSENPRTFTASGDATFRPVYLAAGK